MGVGGWGGVEDGFVMTWFGAVNAQWAAPLARLALGLSGLTQHSRVFSHRLAEISVLGLVVGCMRGLAA